MERSLLLSNGCCLDSAGTLCEMELTCLSPHFTVNRRQERAMVFSCGGDLLRIICFHVSGAQFRKVERGVGYSDGAWVSHSD